MDDTLRITPEQAIATYQKLGVAPLIKQWVRLKRPTEAARYTTYDLWSCCLLTAAVLERNGEVPAGLSIGWVATKLDMPIGYVMGIIAGSDYHMDYDDELAWGWYVSELAKEDFHLGFNDARAALAACEAAGMKVWS